MLDIGYVALFAYREGIRTKIGSVRDVRSRGGFVIFRGLSLFGVGEWVGGVVVLVG